MTRHANALGNTHAPQISIVMATRRSPFPTARPFTPSVISVGGSCAVTYVRQQLLGCRDWQDAVCN